MGVLKDGVRGQSLVLELQLSVSQRRAHQVALQSTQQSQGRDEWDHARGLGRRKEATDSNLRLTGFRNTFP